MLFVREAFEAPEIALSCSYLATMMLGANYHCSQYNFTKKRLLVTVTRFRALPVPSRSYCQI